MVGVAHGDTQGKEACGNDNPHTLPEKADQGQKTAIKCQASPLPKPPGSKGRKPFQAQLVPFTSSRVIVTDTPGLTDFFVTTQNTGF